MALLKCKFYLYRPVLWTYLSLVIVSALRVSLVIAV